MSKFVTQDGIERLIGIVKSELDGKVNEPTTEGTSGQVLTTNGNGGRTWTNSTSISDVSNYLFGGEEGEQLSSGDDLNNYTSAGVYFSSGTSITSSLSNCPTTENAGMLEVTQLVTNLEVTQRWLKRNYAEEWTRHRDYSGTWSDWNKVIKQTDLEIVAPWQSVSVLTQAEYDAIETPVSTTLYLIKEA